MSNFNDVLSRIKKRKSLGQPMAYERPSSQTVFVNKENDPSGAIVSEFMKTPGQVSEKLNGLRDLPITHRVFAEAINNMLSSIGDVSDAEKIRAFDDIATSIHETLKIEIPETWPNVFPDDESAYGTLRISASNRKSKIPLDPDAIDRLTAIILERIVGDDFWKFFNSMYEDSNEQNVHTRTR